MFAWQNSARLAFLPFAMESAKLHDLGRFGFCNLEIRVSTTRLLESENCNLQFEICPPSQIPLLQFEICILKSASSEREPDLAFEI